MKNPFDYLPFVRRFAEQCATCVLGVMALLVFASNYGAQNLLSLSKACETGYVEGLIALQWQTLAGDSASCIVDIVLALISGFLI
jgi:hypothetical protein